MTAADPTRTTNTTRSEDVLRVLQVTPLMTPAVGGLETHVYEIASRLSKYGIVSGVLTADSTGELAVREEQDGFTIERIRAWPTGSDLRLTPGLSTRIAAGRWDLLHVQCFHSLMAPHAMIAARRLRIPYILTFHGGGHSSVLRRAIRHPQLRAMRPLLRHAGALVTLAGFEAGYYARLVGIPATGFVRIPNGSDLPTPRPAAFSGPGTLIVSCGRLEKYKGHQYAIRALPHVLKAIPDARLWVAGQGPFEAPLRRLAARLGVGRNVEIAAAPDRRAMAERLSQASLAVMFSSFETQPIAALEAIALGIPIVVGDNSGLAELALEGVARSVRLQDGPELHAAAMISEIHEPTRTCGFKLSSWEDCARSLAQLYRRVLSRL